VFICSDRVDPEQAGPPPLPGTQGWSAHEAVNTAGPPTRPEAPVRPAHKAGAAGGLGSVCAQVLCGRGHWRPPPPQLSLEIQ